MQKLSSSELREKYLRFFAERGHAVIQSASLIPENDPTVLFTTAGMHPLVPYLGGEKHPMGKRLTDVQKCVRTGDIDEVGDATHCTFFEMLGNWSLGDYFKKESIGWSFEFLTQVLGITIDKLAVSVFAGDDVCERDEESAKIWAEKGIPADRIFYLPRKNNWWGPAGQTGPCGPDTEIFIDTGKEKCCDTCSPACDCGKYIEIWNNVFMQFRKTKEGIYEPLENKNVDTGMGLERTLCILGGYKSVYDTDLFADAVKLLEDLSGKKHGDEEESTRAIRILCDHIRTSVMMLGDTKGITPSNVDQGYILRRLIRRAVRFARVLNLPDHALTSLAQIFIDKYKGVYPEIGDNSEKIIAELAKEENRFKSVIQDGYKELDKVLFGIQKHKEFASKNGQVVEDIISGKAAFRLYDTFGFPIEMTVEIAKERGYTVDVAGFEKAYQEHQEKSRAGAEQKFKGGLADNSEITARLHTATHLLNQGLRNIVSPDINQKGSNITAERLRFDFNLDRPVTPEEIKALEDYVNGAIKADVEIICEEMSVDQAKEKGAVGVFTAKYGDVVKVYTIGKYSCEICGGPHAKRTGELGTFKITKEQSAAAGVRRIRAILE